MCSSDLLGLETSEGAEVGLVTDADNVHWTQQAGFVEEAYKAEPVKSA